MRSRIISSLLITVLILILGTVSYHVLEGWNFVDSFYFTAMTITTVGYGDFTPTHNISKIFTVFFAMFGIGIMFFIFFNVIRFYLRKEEEAIVRRIRKYRHRRR